MGLLNEVAEELLKFLLSPKDNEWIEWIAQENEWQDDCDKFTEYIFDENKNKGKKKLFESLGYTIEDSEYLQQLYISQAIEKYCNGEYVYKGVEYYARIEIVIELPSNNGGIQRIKTGWGLLPKGEIKMATPFSGFAN